MYILNSILGGASISGTGDFQGTLSITDSTINGRFNASGTGNAENSASITGSTINGRFSVGGTGGVENSVSITDSTINGVVSVSPISSAVAELDMTQVRINGGIILSARSTSTASVTVESSLITPPDSAEGSSGVGITVLDFVEFAATNVTITGHEVGLSTTGSAVASFENMLIFGNSVADIADGTNLAGISSSLTETPVDALTGNFGNIAGLPIVDENFNLFEGSPGIDVGNSDAVAPGSLDLNGDDRIQDGDNNGVSVVNLGATETVIPVVIELSLIHI